MFTRFDPVSYQVTRRFGNRITAVRNGKYITHNIAFFKKLLQHDCNKSSDLHDKDNDLSDSDVSDDV